MYRIINVQLTTNLDPTLPVAGNETAIEGPVRTESVLSTCLAK